MADLALFIKAIATRERDLDNARSRVNKLEHIDIIDIFNLINYSKGLGLNKEDFGRFLRDYSIPHTMDSLDSFYNYYSNNNKNDRYVYLIDLKIMLTPTVEHKDEFHITLNDGEELMTTNSVDCLKNFFEIELNLFEKMARLALGFTQFDFDDVWRLFFAGSELSGSVMEDYEFLSLSRLQLFMTEYGLDMSEFEWNMVMRRVLNNPKMTVREISKNEFKSFVKVFRSDYESNREQIIKDILNGAKIPLGTDVASSIMFSKKKRAETTFSKHINFQSNFNASSSNLTGRGYSNRENDSMSANMKSEEAQTYDDGGLGGLEGPKERLTKNTQTTNSHLIVQKLPNQQVIGQAASHNSYKLVYNSKHYEFNNEEDHWSIIQKLKKEGIDVGDVSHGMSSEDVIRRIASTLDEIGQEQEASDEHLSYVYNSGGKSYTGYKGEKESEGTENQKISVTHDYRVKNVEKTEENISVIKQTLEDYEGEFNKYYEESSQDGSKDESKEGSEVKNEDSRDNFRLDFSKISIPNSRKGRFKHPRVIDPKGIFSSRASQAGNMVSESISQSNLSRITDNRKQKPSKNQTPISRSFIQPEINSDKLEIQKSTHWQNSYINLSSSKTKEQKSGKRKRELELIRRIMEKRRNRRKSKEFVLDQSSNKPSNRKSNSFIVVSHGKESRIDTDMFKESNKKYEPRKYLNRLLCNNEALINKISDSVMKNYRESMSLKKNRIFKSSSHIRATRDNVSEFVNINTVVNQSKKSRVGNNLEPPSAKKSRGGSCSVKTYIKKIDLNSMDYVKMPDGAFKYIHENDETVVSHLRDLPNDNVSKISVLESIVDLDSKLRNRIYLSSKPKSREKKFKRSLERKSLKQKKVSYFDQGNIRNKRREFQRLMDRQHQSYMHQASRYVNSSFTHNGNSLLDRKSFESIQLKKLDDINRKLGQIANLNIMKERRSAQVPGLRSKIKEQYLNGYENGVKNLRKSCDVTGGKGGISKKLMKRKMSELRNRKGSSVSRGSSMQGSKESSMQVTQPDHLNNNLSKEPRGARNSSMSSLHERRARVKFGKLAKKMEQRNSNLKSRGSSGHSKDKPIQYWKYSEQRSEYVRSSHKKGVRSKKKRG